VCGIRGADRRRLQRRLHLPQGLCAEGPARRPRPPAPPLVKRDGRFVEASWDEAFAEIERRLVPLLEQQGRDAVALCTVGNPSAHKYGLLLYLSRLAKALGTKNVFSASTLDQMPKQLSSGLMFGHWLSVPVPDIARCRPPAGDRRQPDGQQRQPVDGARLPRQGQGAA
jgi:hypothetical protein